MTKLKIHNQEEVRFIDISVGNSHCLAIDNRNRVFGWGNNNYGQILLPITTKWTENPKEVQLEHKIVEFTLKDVKQQWKSQKSSEMLIQSTQMAENIEKEKKRVSFIKAGYNNSMMVVNDELYVKGANNKGCLSLKSNVDSINGIQRMDGLNKVKVVGMSTGINHSLVWDQNGKLYSFGDHSYGKLGIQ